MNSIFILFVFVMLAVFAFFTIAIFVNKRKKAEALERKSWAVSKSARDLRPKLPLTEREQAMFFRLVQITESDFVVLSQVSFSALIESSEQRTRNQFNRKYADFVICKKSFEVLAVIELDDASHRGREREDAERDELLTSAGYTVVRFKNVPDGIDAANEIAKALAGKKH